MCQCLHAFQLLFNACRCRICTMLQRHRRMQQVHRRGSSTGTKEAAVTVRAARGNVEKAMTTAGTSRKYLMPGASHFIVPPVGLFHYPKRIGDQLNPHNGSVPTQMLPLSKQPSYVRLGYSLARFSARTGCLLHYLVFTYPAPYNLHASSYLPVLKALPAWLTGPPSCPPTRNGFLQTRDACSSQVHRNLRRAQMTLARSLPPGCVCAQSSSRLARDGGLM